MLFGRIVARTAREGRQFSSSALRGVSLESPTYPGLYYHSLPIPHSYALSFLPTPAPSLDFSPSTIGTLANVDNSAAPGVPPNLLPRNFTDNDDFKTLLHEVLQGCIEEDMGIGTMAKIRVDGYMYDLPFLLSHFLHFSHSFFNDDSHIADERNPADPNRSVHRTSYRIVRRN